MKKQLIGLSALMIFFWALSTPIYAAYTIKDGSFINTDELAIYPVEVHYNMGVDAMEKDDWDEASRQFRIVSNSFPNSSYAPDALFYLGAADYNIAEYDSANEAFSKYLKSQANPKFFLEAIDYKFAIAEQFKYGAKRRFFGSKHLPKWATGRSLAVEIYDEIISAMPCNEIAAKALYSKGCLQLQLKDYRQSIESFQSVTKRFPKHELAPECYRMITKVYLEQCQYEFQNPDILAFAQINLRRFKHDFQREERLTEAEQDVLRIKEVYARGLYDTGQFYERIQQPQASVIYYHNAIKQFPDTYVAELCKQRLYRLNPNMIPEDKAANENMQTSQQHS